MSTSICLSCLWPMHASFPISALYAPPPALLFIFYVFHQVLCVFSPICSIFCLFYLQWGTRKVGKSTSEIQICCQGAIRRFFFPQSPQSPTAWSNFSSLLITLPGWVVSLLIKRLDNEHSAFLWLRPLPSHRSATPELIGTFSAGVQFSPLILLRMTFRALLGVGSTLTPVSQPFPHCLIYSSLDWVLCPLLASGCVVRSPAVDSTFTVPAAVECNCESRRQCALKS